jgi:subtilisin family serine protease
MVHRRLLTRRVCAALAVSVLGLVASVSAAAAQTTTEPDNSPPSTAPAPVVRASPDPVPGQYIVTLAGRDLSPQAVANTSDDLARRYSGVVLERYDSALDGFAVRVSNSGASAMAADPAVAAVEQDSYVHVDTTEAPAPAWGLDRIDQPALPLDTSYSYDTGAPSVHAYVIDTGIRATHVDFGSRASVGADFIGDGRNGVDCVGHGTHVAGTIGGAAYGVAKAVSLVAVRVLNCQGLGTTSGVIAGVNWVTAHAIKPAVANVSIQGQKSDAFDTAVSNSIASGITYSVAAGNDGADECTTESPGGVATALTVASSGNFENPNAPASDTRSSYSNFGPCVDLFAPGAYITSDWFTGDTAINTISGTSMAAPHVAGVAALYLQQHPAATAAQVATALTAGAVPAITSPGPNTTSLLLNTAPITASAPDPPVLTAAAAPGVVHLTWTVPADGGAPGGITGYTMYKGTTSGVLTPLVPSLGAGVTTYDDAAVVAGTTYFYQVAAVNGIGETRSAERSALESAVDVFATASDGSLIYRFDVVGGLPFASLGPTTVGNPSIVSDGTGVWAFIRGADNGLWTRRWDGTQWSGWLSLGTTIVSDPSAVWDGTHLWVFARGADNGLWYREWVAGTWMPWATRGTAIASSPSAVWDGARLWVFARGTDNGLWYQQWNGVWSTWVGLGPTIAGDPEGVIAGASTFVFARGADNGLWYRRNTGTGPATWGPWTTLGTTILSNPSVVWDGSTLSAFGLGIDSGVWYRQWNGASWSGWATLGTTFAGNPTSVWDGSDVWVFARASDKTIRYRKLGTGAWTSLGQNVKSDPVPIVFP